MNLEQSEVLVDRALVTLCAELPESLGLYNTAKDQFTIGAIRAVPLLENVMPESRKHYIIRDWMRTYVEHEDQPLGNDISFDSLREITKAERKQRAKEAREKHGDLMSDEEETRSAKKKDDRSNSKGKAAINSKKKAAAAAADAKAKRKPRANDSDESEAEADDSSTTSLSSDASSDELPSDSSSSDDDRRARRKSKSKSSSSKGKEKRTSRNERDDSTKKKKKTKSSKSNLPPIEVVLSSDEDDEPDALFDTDDPDVYEVETILEKRRGNFGEPDMYLIKWVGYDETTWEPAENVSKDLIEEFEGQPVRENEYVVEEILDRKTVRDKETKLRTFKYFVKWVGYDDKTWEPAENLPHNLRRKFDAKYEARKRRRMG